MTSQHLFLTYVIIIQIIYVHTNLPLKLSLLNIYVT